MLDPDQGVTFVVGTRPEVVKMAPLILRLRQAAGLRTQLIATGQHRDLLDQALGEFGLKADLDLDLMKANQSPVDIASRGLSALAEQFRRDRPGLVLAQGDTTTVLCAALAGFYERIPFGHVEAGLRTGRADRPFPEETQRVLVSHLAAIHFAPTLIARANLLREAISEPTIHLTGNTVIDALKLFRDQGPPTSTTMPEGRQILITAHRRENFGEPMVRICRALIEVLDRHPDVHLLWPVHPNPQVQGPVYEALAGRDRVRLVEPLPYREFVRSMAESFVILTDSGGVQEEAPALGKPVVVLREETERGETLALGGSVLVGTREEAIVDGLESILNRSKVASSVGIAAVGDGWASERIAHVILPSFGIDPGPEPEGFVMECSGQAVTW